jgi:hypothetical protein
MSTENYVLLADVSAESMDFVYGAKSKAAGYFNSNDSLHTLIATLDLFVGEIKIQGTLELYPSDIDWVDIVFDSENPITFADSSAITATQTRTFRGNFIWLRAAYRINNGSITQIRYNF